MNSSLLTYVVYTRVSTLEQREGGRSIVDQESKCTRHVEEEGGTLLKAFVDDGFSGSSMNRPGLKEMLRFCQENEVDRVLVVDTDRIARSMENHFAIKALLKKCGTVLESINQPMLSNDSPEGHLLDGVLAAVNAFYPMVTGRKTSDTMKEKALSGWFPGPARLGYVNHHDPTQAKGQRNTIIPHPVNGPLVTQAFELYATGQYSLESLVDEMDKRGLRSINNVAVNHTSMRKMLGDIFYTGNFLYKGEVLAGKHQRLVSDATFERCQIVLMQHNRSADRKRKHQFLLNGFLYCGICGSPCTAEWQLKRNKKYYYCYLHNRANHSNTGQYYPVEEVDAAVEELFRGLTLSQEVVDGVLAEARRILEETHGDIDEKRRTLAANKAHCEARRNALESKLLDGVISDDTYKRQSADVEENLKKISRELILLDDDRNSNIQEMEQLLLLTTNIYQAFKDAPHELKRKYLALFWEKIAIKDRQICEAVPTKLFQAILPETKKPGIKSDFSSVRINFNWLPG